MAREDEKRAALAQALADVLAYRGSAMYAETVRLLDAIEACYMEEMMSVSKEHLEFKQGAARQVRVLRNILVESRADSITDLPKV
jgi:hypothetical protein